MSKTKIFLLLAIGAALFAIPCWAQTTNQPPPTALETVETATGIFVLKSSMPVGSLNVGSAVISVTSKQDTILNPINKNAQQSLYGCSLTVSANSQIIKTLIDGDELNSLLQAIEYIRNVSWSVTALPAFDLSYTTKAGLIVSGFSSKRNGEIEFSIKGNGMQKGVVLTADQVGQLYSLLQDAKAKIDGWRKG